MTRKKEPMSAPTKLLSKSKPVKTAEDLEWENYLRQVELAIENH
jgi:hypothetical protein